MSMGSGSLMGREFEEREEAARRAGTPRGHGIDVCACGAVIISCRCPGPHTPRVVQAVCAKCRPEVSPVVQGPPRSPLPTQPRVGSRRVTTELTAADVRAIVGAPDDAVVEFIRDVDHGPNGTTPGKVTVTWREGA